MSRTRKDKPSPPWPDHGPGDYESEVWREHNTYWGHGGWGYSFRGSRIWRYCRDWWGGERARVRDALRRGEEPEPTRTRNSVKWDQS